jgi:peptidoglycan/LPS O-acetylase OafA/YrhL
MTRATSLFLDVLRLVAALFVFFAHTADYWNPSLNWAMQFWAHDAVIVFFVLSGYVIAHTTRDGVRDARLYAVARLSRLYSVAGPALVLTAILWVVGRELDPEFYAHHQRVYPWARFAISGVFMNEVWMCELSPPTNTPFWSLGYEAWYYVFFAVALFVKSTRWKWMLLAAGALIVGPNILMLLPVWLVGVLAYMWRDRGGISKSAATAGFIVSSALTGLVLLYLPSWPGVHGYAPWYFAGSAISDLIGGIGWAFVIWFFNRAFAGIGVGDRLYRMIRWMAGHTFSLYLYHAPLVLLAMVLVPPATVRSGGWVPLAVILGIIVVLGAVTEAQRAHWQRFFCWLWDLLFRRGENNTPPPRSL